MDAVEKIVGSPSLSRSPRLQALLRYVVKQRLSGRIESPKEHELGVWVLGRRPDYDPQTDPIVRVQARQLRFKLREYYETVGRADRIRIELPKGSYVPIFRHTSPDAAVQSLSEENPIRPADPNKRSKAWWAAGACAVLIGSLIAVGSFSPGERHLNHRPARHQPNAEALEFYLKGRYYWDRRSPESLNKAVDYFTQAVVRDPDYAQSYVGLADSYNLLREYAGMPENEAFPRAYAAAKRAVALDDFSPEAHSSLGFDLFWGEWNVAASEREFRRALQLNPNYLPAHHWYATTLMAQGRMQDAYAQFQRAREIDPASAAVAADYALTLFRIGRREEAIALLQQLEGTDPAYLSPHKYLAEISECTGDPLSFLAEEQKIAGVSQNPEAPLMAATAAAGFDAGGQQGMFEGILTVEEKLYRDGRVSAFAVAKACALAGKRQLALHYLGIAFQRRESAMMALRAESGCSLQSLRDHASFRNLIARVGRSPIE